MRPEPFSGQDQLIDWFVQQLGEHYERLYGRTSATYLATIRYVGSMAMEVIATTNALYHNVEHTMMVTLCGQEIVRGKHLLEGSVRPEDWLHFMVSLLCHDIGYVSGICPGDRGRNQVIDFDGNSIQLPVGGTDALLTPHHIERGKLFVRWRFRDHPQIKPETVACNIENTQFPVPPDEDPAHSYNWAGLVRSADLIGQMGDPEYVRKLPALFHEFEELGSNKKMGYSNPQDLANGYPGFFWNMVHAHIQPALRYLEVTREGREWKASLLSHVFAQEHRTTLSERGIDLLDTLASIAEDTSDLDEAMQACLDLVCDHTGWPVGHAYVTSDDGSGEQIPTTLWHSEQSDLFPVFREVTERTTFAPGIGLPGRVYKTGKPTWIVDVTTDTNFPRAKLAADLGVKAGFGFPVMVGSNVVAVLEFYAEEAKEPDEQELEFMAHVGTVLGQAFYRQKNKTSPEPNSDDLALDDMKGAARSSSPLRS